MMLGGNLNKSIELRCVRKCRKAHLHLKLAEVRTLFRALFSFTVFGLSIGPVKFNCIVAVTIIAATGLSKRLYPKNEAGNGPSTGHRE